MRARTWAPLKSRMCYGFGKWEMLFKKSRDQSKMSFVRCTLISALAVITLSCAHERNDMSAQEYECQPTGTYYADSKRFFPAGWDVTEIELFLTALEEPSKSRASTSKLRPEERLAVNYDAYWTLKKAFGLEPAGLAAILWMVGCKVDARKQYRLAASGIRNEAVSWGQLGVAAHLLRRYEESEQAFSEAIRLDPNYFDMKPVQKEIAEASRSKRPLVP